MNNITKIKSILNEIDEVRNKSAFVPREKWSIDDFSEELYCTECGEEISLGGWIVKSHDEHQAVDIRLYGMESICKPQAEFIVMAANKITQLTRALETAVDALENIEGRYEHPSDLHNINSARLRGCQLEAKSSISKIAEILEVKP